MAEKLDEFVNCFLDEASDLLINWERACLGLEKSQDKIFLEELFRAAHNLKGSSKSVGLNDFGDFVHKVEDLITVLKNDDKKVNSLQIDLLLSCQELMFNWIKSLREDVKFVPLLSEYENALKKVLEVKVDDEAAENGEETQDNKEKNRVSLVKKSPKLPSANPVVKNNGQEMIRISAQKLDTLLQLIGELSIHQAIIWHGKQNNMLNEKTAQKSIYLSNKLAKEIQSQATSLRMQPVGPLFQRLERATMDIARQLGKNIQVILEGDEVELDKAVIESITDPLTHIVRNAVDHGLENKEERKLSGKSEIGTVKIQAIQDPSGISIIISDDGKGIVPRKILDKAISKGLINSELKLMEDEILQLIFLPGFSTAEKVTDISGRGVGMDVVKQAVNSLNGNIKIGSKEGQGSQFHITLPTSLSIIDALIVKINDTKYVVPIPMLDEIVDISNAKITTMESGGKMFSLRGKVMPLESLSSYLPSESKKEKTDQHNKSSQSALVARSGTLRVAFIVDEILGQQQVVIRNLGPSLSAIPGFNGGTILGDGEPGLIIDLTGIANSFLSYIGHKELTA